MGNKKKWFIDAAFLFLIIGLTFYGMLHDEDPRQLLRLLDLADGRYWAAGIVLVFLFIGCESQILRILLRRVGESPKPGHCLVYSFVGFFFSCVTPGAGGGQPAQVYYMHKDGLNPGVTAPILLIVTVCYKFVLVLYGLFAMLFRPLETLLVNDGALLWCFAGWIVTLAVIGGIFLLILKPVLVKHLLDAAMRLAGHFIHAKRLEHFRDRLDRSLDKYREVTGFIHTNPMLFLEVVLISILQRTLLFSVTWLVLLSFGIRGNSIWMIIVLQAMVSLGTDLLPLPGGSGANEALFLLLFESICGEELVLPVLLASRGISYYGQLIISGLVTLHAKRVLKIRKSDR